MNKEVKEIKSKTEPTNQETIRNKKGRFVKGSSGNPTGKNAGRKPILDLYNALDEACIKRNKSFLQHFVERAYENDTVAIALAKKIIPDKLEGEGFDSRNITQIFQDLTATELKRLAYPTTESKRIS